MGVELLHPYPFEGILKQRGQGFLETTVAGFAGWDALHVSDLTFIETSAFELVDEIGSLHKNANLFVHAYFTTKGP
jgi:hypothetical protein